MEKFLSFDRAISGIGGMYGHVILKHVESLFDVKKINEIVEKNRNSSALLLDALQSYCGEYNIERAIEENYDNPKIYFANHPLGGADIVAALKILNESKAPFRILANHAISAPLCLHEQVISVD